MGNRNAKRALRRVFAEGLAEAVSLLSLGFIGFSGFFFYSSPKRTPIKKKTNLDSVRSSEGVRFLVSQGGLHCPLTFLQKSAIACK